MIQRPHDNPQTYHIEHTNMHRLATVHHRQAVQSRNPETRFV